ncbi:MAG: SUMF1/EgtB/PvdO family nonheme iron enzyme [Acidobacteriota bacterium]|nr:SUMF1/EgtB/PvdO family nonheme iron enzyme [Acidobacteriota bacterium]
MKECQHCKKCYTDDVNVCPEEGMPTFHTISGEPILDGKYHLDKRLGQGGMGVVYCARHVYLKTQHAIKVILPDLVGNDPQLVTRFRQEALAAAAIKHYNVVSVTDYGVAMGTMPFLVMEYVEGESLHDLLAREGQLAPEKALELITAICNGIGAAHHQGIVHRDLKPLNIMICNNKQTIAESVKILDFGLAKIKSGELLGSFIQAQTTGLMGSPYYMAPEQWSDEEPDARSDIYSLGVMLFQMLAGDVPFKGSSIPAIMKKHLTDAPPSFAQFGVDLSPQLELAVRHTLEKDPEKRTPSVEAMVGELRNAIGVGAQGIGAITGSYLPVAPLSILTNPAKASVYVDNVAVGQSKPDGLLFLEGIQSGNHHLRVSHDGFIDWENEIVCDGKPRQVVAELRAAPPPDKNAIPRPAATIAAANIPFQSTSSHKISESFSNTQPPDNEAQRTLVQSQQTGEQKIAVESQPLKKSAFSPLLFAVIGIAGLLLLASIGLGSAYLLGVFSGGKDSGNGDTANTTNSTPTASPVLTPTKADMVKIAGGTFNMGRNDGRDEEKPEHPVTVKDFWMDKTEVTNAEYYAFTSEKDYKPLPAHWVNEKPIAGREQMPVRFVNIEDVKTFADWRSKRDKVTYRLPTEEEWEYAARNGSKNNLYPWGDKYESRCAVLDEASMDEVKAVGAKTCPNDWGVQDLIGNVFEWTSSEAKLYPGNKTGSLANLKGTYLMVRGGSAYQKSTGDLQVTSAFRQPIQAEKRSVELGFRLVRSE